VDLEEHLARTTFHLADDPLFHDVLRLFWPGVMFMAFSTCGQMRAKSCSPPLTPVMASM
jgi:hypothetical protein